MSQTTAALIAGVFGIFFGLALNRLLKRGSKSSRPFDRAQAGQGLPNHPQKENRGLLDKALGSGLAGRAGLGLGLAGRVRRQEEKRPFGFWPHPLLLGGISAVLGALPQFNQPYVLSQLILLLGISYCLAWVDLKTLTVESSLVIMGIFARLGAVWVWEREAFLPMLTGLVVGAGCLYLLGFCYERIRGRTGLGDGDPAVLGMIGAYVGLQGLLPVLLLSAVSGILVGFPALALLKRPWNTPIPFVPFLSLAGLVVYVAHALGWRYPL